MLTENDINWLYVYQAKQKNKKYDGRFTSSMRLSAKALYLSGVKIREIRGLLGISSTLLYRWCTAEEKAQVKTIFHNKLPEIRRIRNSEEYKKWRKAVFVRDNWTCTKCSQRGGNLEAHHIKSFAQYPNKRFDVENGQTLCKKCHRLKVA